MKKIIIAIVMLFSMLAGAQEKYVFKRKTKNAVSNIKTVEKYYKVADENAYALAKFQGIYLPEWHTVFEVSPEQKEQFFTLFRSEYQEFIDAAEKYKSTESLQSKLDLLKILIRNEENFRKLLTPDQDVIYRSYDPQKGISDNLAFQLYFFTDKELMDFKKAVM